jgi:hypothetical protein
MDYRKHLSGWFSSFNRIDDKMYLKYQREEDSYNLFNKSTNEVILSNPL